MKSRFHNTTMQYSVVKQVPVKILTTMSRSLETIFTTNLYKVFNRKATGIIKRYGNNTQRTCRFTILFDTPVECPDKMEEILLQIVEWTITESKTEYERKASEKLKKQVKKLWTDYKELKLNKHLI